MTTMKNSNIEWIGEIPSHWAVLRNKYNFDLNKNIVGTAYKDTQLLSLTKNGIKAITEDDQKGKVPTSFATYQTVDKDDIVMCLFDLDVSAVFSGISPYEGMISPAYKCFKCKEHLFPQYIDYYFRTVFVDRKYKRYSKNVRYSISADEFMALPILVPPLEVQKSIANFLDKKCSEIDALSTDIQSQIDILEEYKKSVIFTAVSKGLNPDVEMKDSGTKWLGLIPETWDISKISNVYTLRNTKVSDFEYPPLSVTMKGIVPQLETAAKTNAHDDRKLVKKGDFAINSRSDRRGSCGIADRDGSVSLINTILCPKGEMNPRYYNWLFHTVEFADEFYANGHGIVDDLWTTGWQEMKRIWIPMPPLDVQQEIANHLDAKCAEIDAIIADKKAQLETLAEYKKSLIYEYVTGKKEVL